MVEGRSDGGERSVARGHSARGAIAPAGSPGPPRQRGATATRVLDARETGTSTGHGISGEQFSGDGGHSWHVGIAEVAGCHLPDLGSCYVAHPRAAMFHV